jgi:hypothetical protein
MWELPELKPKRARSGTGPSPLFTLRHSITVTDYTVRIWNDEAQNGNQRWVPITRLPKLALTGLARKILRKAELLP